MVMAKAAVDAYMRYHQVHSKPHSIRAFAYTLEKFVSDFSDRDLPGISADEVFQFLERITSGRKQSTRNSRAGHLSAMYNFIADTLDISIANPCSRGLIKKLYKCPRSSSPSLPDKEVIDEIIYRSSGRNRLMFELMGRTAMRISEVLNIHPADLHEEMNTILIRTPKSGRLGEVVYVSHKIMAKIRAYIRDEKIGREERVFRVSYSTAYRMVKEAGRKAGVKLAPHDFRRHAATQASRSNVPLEIVSKVILRHADIATTQRYLGQVSAVEASRTIENFLG